MNTLIAAPESVDWLANGTIVGWCRFVVRNPRSSHDILCQVPDARPLDAQFLQRARTLDLPSLRSSTIDHAHWEDLEHWSHLGRMVLDAFASASVLDLVRQYEHHPRLTITGVTVVRMDWQPFAIVDLTEPFAARRLRLHQQRLPRRGRMSVPARE